MKTNCIIVDDEPASREVLKRYISDTENLNLIAECKNAIQANEIVKIGNVNLIFLDINMPKISGLQFLKMLTNPPRVIFTTAYSEYALEGFEFNAVDYLLKPFSFERFLRALNKFYQLENNNNFSCDEVTYLKSDKKLYRVPVCEIVYLEAVGDYVKVVFGDKTITVHSTFQNILAKFANSNIVQIHRSFAVALNKIEHIDGNQVIIKNIKLPISKAYRSNFADKIGE